MSNKTKEAEEKKVFLDKEDVKNVRDYLKFFNIDVDPAMQLALDGFEKDQSWKAQEEFRLQVAILLQEKKHPSLQDPVFEVSDPATKKYIFEQQFEKDVNQAFTVEDEAEVK